MVRKRAAAVENPTKTTTATTTYQQPCLLQWMYICIRAKDKAERVEVIWRDSELR